MKKEIEHGATPTETAKVNLHATVLKPRDSWWMNTLDVNQEIASVRDRRKKRDTRKDTTRKLAEELKTMTGRIH